MRTARATLTLLIALLILPIVLNATNTQTINSYDLNCWIFDSTYVRSNPNAINVAIPKYPKSITLHLGQTTNVRNCNYNSCTTVQYYISNCQLLGTYSGAINLTNALTPATTYYLRLDGLGLADGGYSYYVPPATLTIEKYFLYNISEQFEYISDKTLRKKNVNVYSGEGNCTTQLEVNSDFNQNTLTTFNQSGLVNSIFNETNSTLEFNCTEGNYTTSLDLPALQKTITYTQDESNQSTLTTQYIKATAQITNPARSTKYPNIPLNFTLPIVVTNTTGNLQNIFDLNASETKQLDLTASTNQGITLTEFTPKLGMTNATNFHLVKTFQITNNLPIEFTDINTSELMQNPNVQNLITRNWTCALTQNVINLQNTTNVTIECDKEKIITYTKGNITVKNASIDQVNGQIEMTLQNFENQQVDLNLSSILSQNYSRNVNSNDSITLNALETRLVIVNFTGPFLNTERLTNTAGKRTIKQLRVWNETGFNVLGATGSLTAESNWENIKLEVQNGDHYSDITPNSTCNNYTVFNLENGIWTTCKNGNNYNFVIPHFSTVILQISGEQPPAPTVTSNTNNGNGGSGRGGGGSSTSSIAPNSNTVNKTVIGNITNTQTLNQVDFEIPTELTTGEFTTIKVKLNNQPLNGEIVKITRPDESVKTQITNNGSIEFLADKPGKWTIEYNQVKKTFTVNSKTAPQETRLKTNTTPPSSSTGFAIAIPQIPIIPIAITILLAIAAYFAYKLYSNKNPTITREVTGNKVTITITNNSDTPIRNLTLTDVLPEGCKITNATQQPNAFNEMLHGDEYKWQREVIAPKQKWTITYETNANPASLNCQATGSGINNTPIVIKPGKTK